MMMMCVVVKPVNLEPSDKEQLEVSLFQWINRERFKALPKIGGVGLNEMSDLGKLLAIFVIDDKATAITDHSRYFK